MPDRNELANSQYTLDVGGILGGIYNLITGGVSGGAEGMSSLLSFLAVLWQIFSVFSFIASALFLFGIIYAKIRYDEVEEIIHHQIHESEHAVAHQSHHVSKNSRWEEAIHHSESDNPNDWRLAIIEADIILEETLEKLGLPGRTIGDKLKAASPQFMKTVQDAWKAHIVRNDIAHRGSDFILTKRVATETMEHYRRVFEEFHVI